MSAVFLASSLVIDTFSCSFNLKAEGLSHLILLSEAYFCSRNIFRYAKGLPSISNKANKT